MATLTVPPLIVVLPGKRVCPAQDQRPRAVLDQIPAGVALNYSGGGERAAKGDIPGLRCTEHDDALQD